MNEWILYHISDRKQSRNGNDEYFVLSFFDTQSKKHARTYITIGYRNNDWWGQIIVDDLYGIYTFVNLDVSEKNGDLLISGDSIPQQKNITTEAEARAIVDIMGGPQRTYASRKVAL